MNFVLECGPPKFYLGHVPFWVVKPFSCKNRSRRHNSVIIQILHNYSCTPFAKCSFSKKTCLFSVGLMCICFPEFPDPGIHGLSDRSTNDDVEGKAHCHLAIDLNDTA